MRKTSDTHKLGGVRTLILLGLLSGLLLFGCSGNSGDDDSVQSAADGRTSFDLVRGGANQFLLPVQVGSQTFNLLVDTGSNALLVFSDRIDPENSDIEITDTEVSKAYSSTVRSGRLAYAPVIIGGYHADEMAVMAIDSPGSRNDPSLTAKGADGVIGLRRTDGLALRMDAVPLDVPLAALQPAVSALELNLPKTGAATLSFGHMPVLDRADRNFIFNAKTLSVTDGVDRVNRSYSDLQVPFRARSSAGEAADGNLDILLDTGAVSKLVLDTEVAADLGYDKIARSWRLPADEEIELNLVGPDGTIMLKPKFKVSDIKVVPYSTMGVEFEAVLGIDHWQEYVVGFSFVDYQSGGPDGTISMLDRGDLEAALEYTPPDLSDSYIALPGLNSLGDDRFPATDDTGETVVFQSNRSGGKGDWDIYMYRLEDGLIQLPELNSTADDSDPCLSGDGRFLVFQSNRSEGRGSYDILLYDLKERLFLDTSALNSEDLERNPTISRDGRFIAYRAERSGGHGKSDVYLYDRQVKEHIPLPGLNTESNEFDPFVSENGEYLVFHSDRAGDKDVFLYDVKVGALIDLPKGLFTDLGEGINTFFVEHTAAVSADGRWLAFDSNRYHPEMGLYNRDIVTVDVSTGMVVHTAGLNSDFDEIAPSFSGNGKRIAFHSKRPGGRGGSDIYMYRFDSASAEEDRELALPAGNIPLQRTEDGRFAAQIMVNAQKENLLIDTELAAVILFSDRLSPGQAIPAEETVTVSVHGGLLEGEVATVDLALGDYQMANARVILIRSEDLAPFLDEIPDSASGLFGLRFKRTAGLVSTGQVDIPLGKIEPPINMLELNLAPEGEASMSLGSMPTTSRAPDSLIFSSYVAGVVDPADPVHNSFTDIEPPFVVANDLGIAGEGDSILLSTVLRDQLVLDFSIAETLGYEDGSWGDVSEISLGIAGTSAILPIPMNYPVSRVGVSYLGDSDYQAIMSLERWQDFVLGFDFADYQVGGPQGIVSLLHRRDAADLNATEKRNPHNFLPLPGLNSNADDSFGDMSEDGGTIVFQSNRSDGRGDFDIYVYRRGEGLLTLPDLNSAASDADPSISGDGSLVAFQSDRNGDFDLYLYDLNAQSFIDLPGLNSEYMERSPDLSADGAMLAFRSVRPESVEGSSDLYLYSLREQAFVPLEGLWLNTRADEYDPSLSSGGERIGFHARNRDDGQGQRDIFIYDRNDEEMLALPWWVNSPYQDLGLGLSSDGGYLAFSSERGDPVLANQGRDIFLLELSSGEFLFLPGLNSAFEDSAPVLTPQADEILFHSKRPDSLGGYDIYLYRRN